MINEKSITVSIVSQLKSHGNEYKTGKNKNLIEEVRVSEFKASMRFWWRALVYFSEEQIKEIESVLKKEKLIKIDKKATYFECMRYVEGIIFGDTQINASPLEMRLDKYNEKCYCINQNDELTFNMKLVNREFNNKSEQFLKLYNKYRWQINDYIELFKIISVIGSVGGKARKANGTFRIQKIGNQEINIPINNKKLCDMINSLFKTKMYQVKGSKYINKKEAIVSNRSNGRINYPYVKEIFIGNRKIENINSYVTKVSKIYKKEEVNNYNLIHKRFTNPVYVTIAWDGEDIKPVITVLNNTSIKTDNENNINTFNDYVRKMYREVFENCINIR